MPVYDESCQLPYHERRAREEHERAREQHVEKLQLVEELGDAVHPAYRALLENKGHRVREDNNIEQKVVTPLSKVVTPLSKVVTPLSKVKRRQGRGFGIRTSIYFRPEQLARIDERCAALGLTRSQYLVQLAEHEALGHNSFDRNLS